MSTSDPTSEFAIMALRRSAMVCCLALTLTLWGCATGSAGDPHGSDAAKAPDQSSATAPVPVRDIAVRLKVGDLIFIRVRSRPFREVARATGSWANHVGIVVATAGDEPLVAESTFPLSKATRFSSFVGRSEDGRTAVLRLGFALTAEQEAALARAAERRYGVLYDTGFDLRSERQFCSRYVREVMLEAVGTELGEVETFRELLARQPDADQTFWRIWFFGRIPWDRQTVTPASLMRSDNLVTLFDGRLLE